MKGKSINTKTNKNFYPQNLFRVVFPRTCCYLRCLSLFTIFFWFPPLSPFPLNKKFNYPTDIIFENKLPNLVRTTLPSFSFPPLATPPQQSPHFSPPFPPETMPYVQTINKNIYLRGKKKNFLIWKFWLFWSYWNWNFVTKWKWKRQLQATLHVSTFIYYRKKKKRKFKKIFYFDYDDDDDDDNKS